MMRCEIVIDQQAAVEHCAAMPPLLNQAISSSLNKMASWLKTRALKDLSQELMIQQKLLRRRLKMKRLSTYQRQIFVGLDPIALIYLNARQNKRGVSAMGGRHLGSGFIAKDRFGHRQVFKRTTAKRLPIQKQSVAIDEKAESVLESRLWQQAGCEQKFFQILEHEIAWRMQKR